MARQLTEAEQVARKKYGGLTRREYNATKGRHSKMQHRAREGNFEVAALFYGNGMPQNTTFPNIAAASAHFDKLSSNANISVLKLIEYRTKLDAEGKPTNETVKSVICQLNRTNQRFVNSKAEHIWKRLDTPTEYRKKAIEASDSLMEAHANGGLVLSRVVYYDGNPWWERRQ